MTSGLGEQAGAPRTGGQVLVECLGNFGVRRIFGVPGESYLPVLDALYETQGKTDFVTCRQEGGASFMAAAWAKLTREPGVCLVTRGPGATNAAIGVHAARQDSVPMLLLIGQVGTQHLGREAFQEVDYGLMFGDLAKAVMQVASADRMAETLNRAWNVAVTGRPGPVVLVLPEDVLVAETLSPAIAQPRPAHLGGGDLVQLHHVETLLKAAHRPLILTGDLHPAASTLLKALAERNHMPVVTASRCQSAFDNGSPAFAGEAGVGMPAHVEATLRAADCILALNVRFDEMTTKEWSIFQAPIPAQTIIQVHPSAEEIGKIYWQSCAIQGDPHAFLTAFLTAVGERALNCRGSDWMAACRARHRDFLANLKATGPVNMAEVTAQVQARLPEDAILTNGAGNFTFWPNKAFQFGEDQRLLAPISGAMGYGLPAAIAAKLHDPAKAVVCFAGDGDFQMTCQELATARQYGACPVIMLINNGRYGTIRMHQERDYPGRVSGTDCWNPNFVALAQSYGLYAEKIEQTQDFAVAFERALATKTGALLELIVDGQ